MTILLVLGGMLLVSGALTAWLSLSPLKKMGLLMKLLGLTFFGLTFICMGMYQFGQQNKTLPDMSGYCQGGPVELLYIGKEDKEVTEKYRRALQRNGKCRIAVRPLVKPSAFGE